jgi:hypothetical protein
MIVKAARGTLKLEPEPPARRRVFKFSRVPYRQKASTLHFSLLRFTNFTFLIDLVDSRRDAAARTDRARGRSPGCPQAGFASLSDSDSEWHLPLRLPSHTASPPGLGPGPSLRL